MRAARWRTPGGGAADALVADEEILEKLGVKRKRAAGAEQPTRPLKVQVHAAARARAAALRLTRRLRGAQKAEAGAGVLCRLIPDARCAVRGAFRGRR